MQYNIYIIYIYIYYNSSYHNYGYSVCHCLDLLNVIMYFLDDVHNIISNVRGYLTIDTPSPPIMQMTSCLSRVLIVSYKKEEKTLKR